MLQLSLHIYQLIHRMQRRESDTTRRFSRNHDSVSRVGLLTTQSYVHTTKPALFLLTAANFRRTSNRRFRYQARLAEKTLLSPNYGIRRKTQAPLWSNSTAVRTLACRRTILPQTRSIGRVATSDAHVCLAQPSAPIL